MDSSGEGGAEVAEARAAAAVGPCPRASSVLSRTPAGGPMAWGGGWAEPTPGPPLLSSDSLLEDSTLFFWQETEAHGEEEAGGDLGEAGWWWHK